MTVRGRMAGLAAFGLLAACDDAREPHAISEDRAAPESVAAFAERGREVSAAPEPSSDDRQGGQMLAYTFDTALMLPPASVVGVMGTHRDACQSAGPAVCQVLSASLYGQTENNVSAALSFRAAPDYMAAFRAGLTGDAEAAGGRLTSAQQRVEDLTRQVLDLRARLDAQRTLRDRLKALLERQDGAVADLLQVEQELARVQGTIESQTSQLRYLEGRVSMNLITVDYQSVPRAFTPAKRQPLLDAVRDFFGILATSVANVIRFIAAALPWVVIGLPVLWFAARRWRARRV